MAGVNDVAQWMLDELKRQQGWLAQDDAAASIAEKFGESFLHDNDNGNLAISREVLAAFRTLTSETVVWQRSERAWRWREPDDPKYTRQAE